MPWGVMAAALAASAGSYSAMAQARAGAYAGHKAPEPDLEQLARQHRARMEAETAKTLRDAKVGTILLLALFATVAIGIGQLCGVIPVI